MMATPGDYAPPLSRQPRVNVSANTTAMPTTRATVTTVTKLGTGISRSAVDGRSGSLVVSIVWIVLL